jgi:hypothetical protein
MLVVVILVFALVIWFITSDDKGREDGEGNNGAGTEFSQGYNGGSN